MSDEHAAEIAGPYSLSVDTYFGRTRWFIERLCPDGSMCIADGPFYDKTEAWNLAQFLNAIDPQPTPTPQGTETTR